MSESQVRSDFSVIIRSGLDLDFKEGKIWILTPYFSSNQEKISLTPLSAILLGSWTFNAHESRGSIGVWEDVCSPESSVPISVIVSSFCWSEFPHGTKNTKIQQINPNPAKNKICLISDLMTKR